MREGQGTARSETLTAALAALRRGSGVVIVGERGSGRTRFLQSVLAESSPETRGSLWIDDDVHRLEPEQADRLARAVRAGTTRPLVTALSRHPLPRQIERLCGEGLVITIELPELTAGELLRFVEGALDLPLHPECVPAFLPRRRGGDLVVLRESVLDAIEAGALEEDDGYWRLTTLVPPSERLRRLIHSRLDLPPAMESEAALVLDVLGLAPELRLGHCVSVAAGEARTDDMLAVLEQLESCGVIDVLGAPDELRLRIHDPVVELVMPQTIGVLRRNRLTTALVDLLGSYVLDDLAGPELAALAKHALPLGRSIDPAAMTGAAVAAMKGSRFELALQLGSTAVRHGGGFDAQLVLAAAESRLGQGRAALTRLDALVEEAGGDPARLEALTTLTGDVLEQLGEPVFGWDLPSDALVDARGLDLASVLRLDWTRDKLAPVRDGEPAVPERLHAMLGGERHVQDSIIAAMKGDLIVAHEHLDAGEALVTDVDADSLALQLRRLFADSLDGKLGECIEITQALAEQAAVEGQAVNQAVATWLTGHLLLYSGRLVDATLTLTASARMMDRTGMQRTALLARAEAAIAFGQLGETVTAAETLAPALVAPDDRFAIVATAHQAAGWIHAAAGRRDDAVESFIAAADTYDSLGHELIAVVPLVEAARAGAARRVLARLDERAEVVQGANCAVLIRHGRVLAWFEAHNARAHEGDVHEGDVPERMADEFDAVGADYAAVSFHLNAAEAFSRAALLHGQAGHERQAAASSRCAARELAVCGITSAPLMPALTSTLLSRREQEIAALAAEGRSNREIGSELVLSVRTVETHLLRVYRKLGIRNRSELPTVLGQRSAR
ncbi:helix-turn-helix transcriptional regulator [Herbiconiux liangxiaofengii]|uniref:helix-turn-helix transcriptional regulator n=1 Tax=Herbiconiux liangxiaofengii TaxID=3342795 RepID=UPI0035BA3789